MPTLVTFSLNLITTIIFIFYFKKKDNFRSRFRLTDQIIIKLTDLLIVY